LLIYRTKTMSDEKESRYIMDHTIDQHCPSCRSTKLTQNDSRYFQSLEKKYQPVVIPDPPVTGPILRADSQGLYNNRIYENGIKGAEYQNRGAEDRRNVDPANPNAIPNKQVPAKEVLPPDTVK
jgi:hypothetical protein